MKKLLLTFFVVFSFVGMAIAQEPAKVAKKKAAKSSLAPIASQSKSAPASAEMIKAKADEAAKATEPKSPKASRATAAADKIN